MRVWAAPESTEGVRVEAVNAGQPPVPAIARDLTAGDLPTIPLSQLEEIPEGTLVGRLAGSGDGAPVAFVGAVLSTSPDGTYIGRALGAGTGLPSALAGGELAKILRFSNVLTETVGGTFNNTVVGDVDTWRFTATSVINGIVCPTPTIGKELLIDNGAAVGSGITVTCVNESGSSVTSTRFNNPESSNVVLQPGQSARYRYGVSSPARWRLCGTGGLPLGNATVGKAELKGGILISLLGTTPTATASAADLSAGSVTILANTTSIGTTYIGNLSVEFIHTASATPTLTIDWVYGAAVVCTRVITVTAVAGTYTLWVEGYFRHTSVGAASSARVSIRAICTAGASVNDQIGETTATPAALNTTVDRTLELRVRMTSVVAANTITLHQATLMRIINL